MFPVWGGLDKSKVLQGEEKKTVGFMGSKDCFVWSNKSLQLKQLKKFKLFLIQRR